jgi:hypothetical protein
MRLPHRMGSASRSAHCAGISLSCGISPLCSVCVAAAMTIRVAAVQATPMSAPFSVPRSVC